jgi:hypothetical protein
MRSVLIPFLLLWFVNWTTTPTDVFGLSPELVNGQTVFKIVNTSFCSSISTCLSIYSELMNGTDVSGVYFSSVNSRRFRLEVAIPIALYSIVQLGFFMLGIDAVYSLLVTIVYSLFSALVSIDDKMVVAAHVSLSVYIALNMIWKHNSV